MTTPDDYLSPRFVGFLGVMGGLRVLVPFETNQTTRTIHKILRAEKRIFRNGAKTLIQDAKAGVDAVGASWQNSREEAEQQRFNRTDRLSRGLRQKDIEGKGEFDVRCSFVEFAVF